MRKYRGKLKMFVWDNFLPDYTEGIAVAVAETVDEARALVRAECLASGLPSMEKVDIDLTATPIIKPLQSAAFCFGGA